MNTSLLGHTWLAKPNLIVMSIHKKKYAAGERDQNFPRTEKNTTLTGTPRMMPFIVELLLTLVGDQIA